MNRTYIYILDMLLGIAVVLVGCQNPGPIELEQTDEQVSEVEPITVDPTVSFDTTGVVAAESDRYGAELVVAGVRYDGPIESHAVSLSQAVFYDTTRPVFIDGRRVGFHTLDVGDMFIDGLPLYKIPKRLRVRPQGGAEVDTVLGAFYALLNRDGVGGRGFQYAPVHRYEWTNARSTVFSVDVRAVSAREIRVLKPTPSDIIIQRQNLLVQWTGGEDAVYLIIGVPQSGMQTIPMLRMRLRSVSRQVVIPAKILQLLPTDRTSKFLFTFVSRVAGGVQVGGFPNNVLVHSASIHNVLVTVER